MKQLYFLVTIYITLMQGECCQLRHVSKRKVYESKPGFVYHGANSEEAYTSPIVTTEENKYGPHIQAIYQWPRIQYSQNLGSSSQISYDPKRGGNRQVLRKPFNNRRVSNIYVQRYPFLNYPVTEYDQEYITPYYRPQFQTGLGSVDGFYIEKDISSNYPVMTSKKKDVILSQSKPQNSVKPFTLNIYGEKDITTKLPVTTPKEELVIEKFEPHYYTIPGTLNFSNNEYDTTTIYPLTTTTEEQVSQSNFKVENETKLLFTTPNQEPVTDQYLPQDSGSSVLFNDTNGERNTTTENFGTKSRAEDLGFNVSALIGRFGLSMLQLANQQKNLVLSPCSITTLLALLQQGAAGETQQEISTALQMPVNVTAIAYNQLTAAIRKRRGSHNVLSFANNVFLADNFDLEEDFKRKAIENFGSEVTSIDFSDTKAAQIINTWVSNATNNKINQILSSGSVNGDTELVLVNALLFKGVWKSKFTVASTIQREFYINAREHKTVPFMHARRNYRCGEDKSSHHQVVVLPFEKNEYSLMIILPSEKSNITESLRNLTYNKLVEYNNFEMIDVDLELPKFAARSNTNLQPLLEDMGVKNMFGTTSELNNIINGRIFGPQVSSAIHSAMLSIDEEGGTASASTAFVGIALSYNSPDVVFKANRPFLAILWDSELALPLIMATIDNPTL